MYYTNSNIKSVYFTYTINNKKKISHKIIFTTNKMI